MRSRRVPGLDVPVAIILAVNHAAAGLGETTAHSLARITKS